MKEKRILKYFIGLRENRISVYLDLLLSCLLLVANATSLDIRLSADNLCKQFEPRSDPTKFWARSGSKLFVTLMVFLKEFFEKVDFEKNQATKKHAKLHIMQ